MRRAVPAKLKSTAGAEWDRFYAALKTHGQGHSDLADKHLSDVDASLGGKTEEEAKAAFREAVQKLQEASDADDVKTDHGRKRSTVLETSIK